MSKSVDKQKPKSSVFRLWFYLRNGWAMYFTFLFATVNTLTVTYFLAVDNYPILKEIFPNFQTYIVVALAIGIPLVMAIGYIHYKKSQAYSSEIEILAETTPYYFRIPPGWNMEVVFPLYLLMSKMLLQISNNEKINTTDLNEIKEIQKKIQVLLEGGPVGKPRKTYSNENETQ